jgi:hypothetical protein
MSKVLLSFWDLTQWEKWWARPAKEFSRHDKSLEIHGGREITRSGGGGGDRRQRRDNSTFYVGARRAVVI